MGAIVYSSGSRLGEIPFRTGGSKTHRYQSSPVHTGSSRPDHGSADVTGEIGRNYRLRVAPVPKSNQAESPQSAVRSMAVMT